jgi:hypothetical protein
MGATGFMSSVNGPELLERVNRALGQVRAEYESDDELYRRFAAPLYFKQLVGITPSFLVGGRGTGKTTTLRSMSFGGQARISESLNPSEWEVVGGYWKVEPNVVSVFRGKGVPEELWSSVFSHYLNLKLSSLVVDYAEWLVQNSHDVRIETHQLSLFIRSLNLKDCESLKDLSQAIDLALVDIEATINGNISALSAARLSVLGRPLDYLFAALGGLGVSQQRPYMFCLDEYENLSSYQQKLLNTLIKQVGGSPYTFKIGVRNTVAIERATLVDEQPLQDPADFTTINIVTDLKGESFERFAEMVVGQRLALIDASLTDPGALLKTISLEEEAYLLGADAVRLDILKRLNVLSEANAADLEFARTLPTIEACMVSKWAESHDESELAVLRFARDQPEKWSVRMGNYGYAMLFTIRQNRVGERKYYAGWKTYCQLADGNIRYMIRLVYEALRLHVIEGGGIETGVSVANQTRAATQVGETTIRDLQGWSRHGAPLTRLVLGLGSIFGSLAREMALATPEVNQFRVKYSGNLSPAVEVDGLLGEAVGQGILIAFSGDKNARNSGATREMDYQLHPVLAPHFVYGSRRKRRMTIQADDLMALTSREFAAPTIRRILGGRGANAGDLPNQLIMFAE